MRKGLLWCGVLLLSVTPVRAEPKTSRLVEENWDAIYLEGIKAGYQHTVVHEIERDGQKIYRVSRDMSLTLKRYNSVIRQRLTQTNEEKADGKVLAISLSQQDGGLTVSGRVENGQLIVRSPREPNGRAIPWNDAVVGMYQQERLFRQRKVRPGDHFAYLDFQPALLAVVTMKVVVKDREDVDLLVVKEKSANEVDRVRRKLLRVEVTPDKVKMGDTLIPLPRVVQWLDHYRLPVRQEFEVSGMGRLTMYRTPRAVAEQEGVAPEQLPDLGLTNFVRLAQRLHNPHQASDIVYRVTIRGDDDPATLFSRDARQQVRAVRKNTFELHVQPVREPGATAKPVTAPADCLKSSHFLDSDNPRIQRLAHEIVGEESDPWRKARRIEKWVHEQMKPNNAVGNVPASQVARDLRGDCRQHAMLTAALCRAAGVPARTAIGLVYGEEPEVGPVFAFHMWTEVWIRGQWLGLDATLGEGSVGPAHLKVTDNPWNDSEALAALLPVIRVLGKLRIEVLSVK